jgi:hypothetical protein
MKVKMYFGGEALNVPSTSFGIAFALVSVWIDGRGFTSAENSIGTIGFVSLETEEVDLGDVGDEKNQTFSNLHGTVVQFDIKTNLFVKDGGIATITMTVAKQQDGQLNNVALQFQATACRGVSVVTNPISFNCEMLQLPSPVALNDDGNVMSDDVLTGLAAAAPATTNDQQAVA